MGLVRFSIARIVERNNNEIDIFQNQDLNAIEIHPGIVIMNLVGLFNKKPTCKNK